MIRRAFLKLIGYSAAAATVPLVGAAPAAVDRSPTKILTNWGLDWNHPILVSRQVDVGRFISLNGVVYTVIANERMIASMLSGQTYPTILLDRPLEKAVLNNTLVKPAIKGVWETKRRTPEGQVVDFHITDRVFKGKNHLNYFSLDSNHG